MTPCLKRLLSEYSNRVLKQGAYAEYLAVDSQFVATKPTALDHNHSAAVPLAALTAWQSLFDIGSLQAGQKVLIHAASGGVGSFAVQFAKARGAHVTGTASSNNEAFVRGAWERTNLSIIAALNLKMSRRRWMLYLLRWAAMIR